MKMMMSTWAHGLFLVGVASTLLLAGCERMEPAKTVSGNSASTSSKKAEKPVSGKATKVSLPATDYTGGLSEADKGKPVATVNGKDITMAALYNEVGPTLFKLRTDIANKEYMTMTRGLDTLIEKQLLEEAAATRGISVDALVKEDIESKVDPPTDEELQQFFNQNRRRMPPGTTFESKRAELLEAFMGRKVQREKGTYVEGLRDTAKVTTLLPYPDLPIADISSDDDPRKGPADAPIEIVEWSDYQCPYCKRNVPVMAKVIEKYGDKVSIVFRDFPLPFHKKAQKAAEAANCAGEQDRYWDFHDKLFANQSKIDIDDLKALAGELKLDQSAFDSCLDSGKFADEIAKDLAEGKMAGVTGTPASFINGKMVNGAQPFSTYQAVIDSELARLKR